MMANSAASAVNDVKDLSAKEKLEVAGNVIFDIKKKLLFVKLLPFILIALLILLTQVLILIMKNIKKKIVQIKILKLKNLINLKI